MCNEDTVRDADEYLNKNGRLSRRRFGTLTAGAALAMLLPRAANAQDVSETDVSVTTPDGKADCYFVHPATGRHPGVIIWPDILGLRPAFRAMGIYSIPSRTSSAYTRRPSRSRLVNRDSDSSKRCEKLETK